jgi:hypothetical protein
MTAASYDVVVVGGGPAGLSAALALGRAVKRVLLCDAGPRRNAAAEHMHGFVSREAIPPLEFRRIAREQLRPYDVTVTEVGVQDLVPQAGGFMVTLADGTPVTCRRALLAAGMIDEIPPIPGMDELWGHSVFLCPYCHGWEVRDRPSRSSSQDGPGTWSPSRTGRSRSPASCAAVWSVPGWPSTAGASAGCSWGRTVASTASRWRTAGWSDATRWS